MKGTRDKLVRNHEIYAGARFGYYTVVGELVSVNKEKGIEYSNVSCECDCGRIKTVQLRILNSLSKCLFCRKKHYSESKTPTIKTMSPQYTAALFDGEGSIGIYGNSKNGFIISATIAGCWLPTIEILKDDFGGSIGKSRKYVNKQGWQWSLGSKKGLQEFLSFIVPFCLEKKTQVNVTIMYLEDKISVFEAAAMLKDLKKTDWRERSL